MTPATTVAQIRKAVAEIWSSPPADLDGPAASHRPPSRDMVKRLYANFDLYWSAWLFHFAAQRVREEQEAWDETALRLAALADACARRLDLWNCTSAGDVLRRASKGMGAAGSQSELLDAVDQLVLYLNVLQSWVDASIPWSAIDEMPPRDVRILRS